MQNVSAFKAHIAKCAKLRVAIATVPLYTAALIRLSYPTMT